jgi:hypothetical protein
MLMYSMYCGHIIQHEVVGGDGGCKTSGIVALSLAYCTILLLVAKFGSVPF